LFDQVPRNAYRGTAAAFAFDREALALSLEGLQLAADAALDPSNASSSIYRSSMPSRWKRRTRPIEAFGRLVAEAPPDLRDYCAYTAGLRAQCTATSLRSSAAFRIGTRC
jgi:hypothetical protein